MILTSHISQNGNFTVLTFLEAAEKKVKTKLESFKLKALSVK